MKIYNEHNVRLIHLCCLTDRCWKFKVTKTAKSYQKRLLFMRYVCPVKARLVRLY